MIAACGGGPQARHIHALLPRGREILEELFPGLTVELIADGAASGDLLGDARLHLSGHRFRRGHSDLHTISASRPFLEDRVRERVRCLPRVRFVDPCDVVGLVVDDLATAFARVMALADPPGTLMRPQIALRVLRPGVRRGGAPPQHHSTRNRPQKTPTKGATS